MNNISRRDQITVNTDPQRRCYNGAHFSSRQEWGGWWLLEYNVPDNKIAQRMEFWRELNDYAISQRGESARAEFKSEKTL